MIKHNLYQLPAGDVHSLGFQANDFVGGVKTDYTVGVIEVGAYDFGTAHRSESITIVSGAAQINGQLAVSGERVEVARGENVSVCVPEGTVVYLCKYGPATVDELFSKKPSETLLVSIWTEGQLTKAGIKTIEQLVKLSVSEAFGKLGRKPFDEINGKLSDYRLRFGMTDDDIQGWTPGN